MLFGGVGSAVFAGLLADGVVVFQVVFARVGCAAVLLLGWCLGWFGVMVMLSLDASWAFDTW